MNRFPASTLTPWTDLSLANAPADGPVAFRDDLSPHTLLEAYRNGLYPFPAETDERRLLHEISFEAAIAGGRVKVLGDTGNPYSVAWWSPDPRPVIAVGRTRVQRSLRQQLRKVNWTTTLDACFERVVNHCRLGREPRWLTDELLGSLCRLHESGHAHSVEVWDGNELIGGTFGVRVGGVFSADSQFNLRSGAAKVAVADLVRRFGESGGIAVDVQHDGDHARLLGARPVPRSRYLELLRTHAASGTAMRTDPLPARRLAS
jgi:leucyl/phenylalanyl-tRNA---protein transferase